MPSFEGGFLLLQRKNTKKKKNTPPKKKKRMGKEHKLVFDFGLPWEYFSSAFQIKKKTSKKKKIKRNNRTKQKEPL